MSDTITCPKCKYEIEVAEALSAHVRVELRKEFDAAQSKKETELEAKWNEERQQLISQAAQKAKEQVAVDMQDMQQQLPDSHAKLKASQKVELDLRKERRELEEAKESFELTLNRQLDEERIKIRDKAKKESVEERQLKEAEKDKLISDLGSQIEDLKRKLEQGSQQTQGEVLELELESSLGTPIGAALLAERTGLVVAQNEAMPIRGCFVRLAQPVKIAGDLRVAGAEHSQGAIVVGPAERPERLQWAVVHEIGESIAYRVFATLGVELEVAPSSAREIVANHLASALLLPRMQFAAAGRELDWDLFGLQQLHATASHDLIARRMLEMRPAIVITMCDQGSVRWRRSNLPGRPPQLFPREQNAWQRCHELGAPTSATLDPAETGLELIRAWPIHEPDWKREILRSEVAEW